MIKFSNAEIYSSREKYFSLSMGKKDISYYHIFQVIKFVQNFIGKKKTNEYLFKIFSFKRGKKFLLF